MHQLGLLWPRWCPGAVERQALRAPRGHGRLSAPSPPCAPKSVIVPKKAVKWAETHPLYAVVHAALSHKGRYG